jgi:hypothetical protein
MNKAKTVVVRLAPARHAQPSRETKATDPASELWYCAQAKPSGKYEKRSHSSKHNVPTLIFFYRTL